MSSPGDFISYLKSFTAASRNKNMPDVIGELLISRGEAFSGESLPRRISRGTAKECFSNASLYLINNPIGHRYFEGYAVNRKLRLMLHHAWVVNEQGKVIDLTWDDAEDCLYFGVSLDQKELLNRLRQTGSYGVLFRNYKVDKDYIYQQFNWQIPEL